MVRVAVGVIEQDGHVLVCRRRKGSRYELKWEFPGGKIETGEDPRASLQREILEELAIDVRIGEEIFRQQWQYEDKGKFDIQFYAIERFIGQPKNIVFEEVRWVLPEDLEKLDLLEGSRGVVQHLVKRIQTGET